MKAITKIFYFHVVLLLLAGCGGNTNGEPATEASEDNTVSEQAPKGTTETDESKSTSEREEQDMENTNNSSEESTQTKSNSDASETTNDQQGKETLSDYSSQEIEYARVWLQLGANQDIDGLYVNYMPAGTPLNPDDETSGTYPEDVIQLAGSRLVDGSVTYSGNGDGTINVYNVPLRWDGNYPAGEDFYSEIINNTELVPIDVGDDKEVIRLIKLLNVES
ncbi:hypothetical protein B0H99_102262 [Planomicrobium soli]|uniref:Lipoprotein n=1 Tax=Planomicrobium soli TaxID=1176648 RepID=A0A2P8H5U1_9BACL|nr:hypothetical protein [Planomicrobium soli]PSL41578.1 hypothetical protein B0H99_102262 [Planomicrobium soli]